MGSYVDSGNQIIGELEAIKDIGILDGFQKARLGLLFRK